VINLLVTGVVSMDQVEQAAVLIPTQTNGNAKPRLPAPLLVEPAPPPAPALALTTAEKVFALTPKACRWPYGDPGHPDFRFCGSPVVAKPYCEHHRTVAAKRAAQVWRCRLSGRG